MQPRSGCADPQNPFFLSLLFCRFSDCRLFCWFSSAFASIPSASLCFCFPLPNVRESLLCCTRLSSALADRLRRLLIPSPDLIGMQGSNNPQSLSGGILADRLADHHDDRQAPRNDKFLDDILPERKQKQPTENSR